MKRNVAPLALPVWLILAASALAADSSCVRLERELERISVIAGGTVGAAAIHIESGRIARLQAQERFPMASTFKVPVAVQLLGRIDRGEERLDRMIAIEPKDLHPGSGALTALFNKPGVSLSVRNLMELMLLISDNSATDILVKLAGGPEAVTARMRTLGLTGIRVDRPTIGLIGDITGTELPPEEQRSPEKVLAKMRDVPEDRRKAALERFLADPRDTATPEDMARLLVRVFRKDLLQPASADLLLDIMNRCQTGDARLKGMLPQGTPVAHKTGTLDTVADDVGIVTLPDGAGHIAIAVFVKGSLKEPALRERAIAEVGRAAYDFFLFNRME